MGALMDGDMDMCIFEQNDAKYLGKKDLLSWYDILEIVDNENGNTI